MGWVPAFAGTTGAARGRRGRGLMALGWVNDTNTLRSAGSKSDYVITFFVHFVSTMETNLPSDIISAIFTAHYVSFGGAK